ncbi:MAG: c-type cytochrome [Proteobacteria bacterium]|nr:c-type cytochrome [Pseudomonadota bacterium]MCH8323160.1 c-type cytochrome [Pseudomonadota bacterium]
MKIFKKILKWGGLGILVLVVAFLGASEYILTSAPDPSPVTLTLPTDEASLLEGERLSRMSGCTGCHTEDLAGQIFFDEPVFARLVVPNLTHFMKTQTVEALEAAIRQGIGFDGRPLVLMPSPMYRYLTDEETAKIIAFLKTKPVVENDLPDNFFGPMSRFLFLKGEFKTAPTLIAEQTPLRFSAASAPKWARGEKLALGMCTECHGQNLEGTDEGDFYTPDLSIAAAYTLEEFSHLMNTGEALGGRELGLMTEVAKSRFSYLFEDEVSALHAYLLDRAEREMEEGSE